MYRVKTANVSLAEKDSFLRLCASFGEVDFFEMSSPTPKAGVLDPIHSATSLSLEPKRLTDVAIVGYLDKIDCESAQKNLDGMIFCGNVLRASLVKT